MNLIKNLIIDVKIQFQSDQSINFHMVIILKTHEPPDIVSCLVFK